MDQQRIWYGCQSSLLYWPMTYNVQLYLFGQSSRGPMMTIPETPRTPRVRVQPELVDTLVHSADNLVRAVDGLRDTVNVTRWQRLVIGGMFVITMLTTLFMAGQFIQYQNIAEGNRVVLFTIQDCLQQTGTCAQQNRANQERIIAEFNKAAKVAAVCAVQNDT